MENQIESIIKHSNYYKIDPNELYGILMLEHINRGNSLNRSIERLLVKFFISFPIKLDLSVGISQIRISTAKQFYPNIETKTLTRKLMTDGFNIRVCAQIINHFYSISTEENRLLGLVKYYTTGSIHTKNNRSIIIYYLLLKWIKMNIRI
jgi:hypothetical protein